jgi:hypothetical protein
MVSEEAWAEAITDSPEDAKMRLIGKDDAMPHRPSRLKKRRRVERNRDEASIFDSRVDLAPIVTKELFSRIAQMVYSRPV